MSNRYELIENELLIKVDRLTLISVIFNLKGFADKVIQ